MPAAVGLGGQKVPWPREGAERRLGLVQPLDGEAERAGSRLRGCSRGPLGHDSSNVPAVDARVGGERVDGSGGAGPSAAGARGRPFPPRHLGGVSPTGLCPAPRSAPEQTQLSAGLACRPAPARRAPAPGGRRARGGGLAGSCGRGLVGGRPHRRRALSCRCPLAARARSPADPGGWAAPDPLDRPPEPDLPGAGRPGWEPGVSGPVS